MRHAGTKLEAWGAGEWKHRRPRRQATPRLPADRGRRCENAPGFFEVRAWSLMVQISRWAVRFSLRVRRWMFFLPFHPPRLWLAIRPTVSVRVKHTIYALS